MPQPSVPSRATRRLATRRLALVSLLGLLVAACAGGTAVSSTSPGPETTAPTQGPAASPEASPTPTVTASPAASPTATLPSPAASRTSGALDPCALLTTDEVAAALGVGGVSARPDPSTPGFCVFAPVSGGASVSVGVNTDLPQMVVFGLEGSSVAGLGQQAVVGNGVIGVLVNQKLGVSIRGTLANGSPLSDAALTDLARKAVGRAG